MCVCTPKCAGLSYTHTTSVGIHAPCPVSCLFGMKVARNTNGEQQCVTCPSLPRPLLQATSACSSCQARASACKCVQVRAPRGEARASACKPPRSACKPSQSACNTRA
eukprot:13097020-Alexandrium_andersonii.AAC.1